MVGSNYLPRRVLLSGLASIAALTSVRFSEAEPLPTTLPTDTTEIVLQKFGYNGTIPTGERGRGIGTVGRHPLSGTLWRGSTLNESNA
mmetsp:Transcript_63021/g.172877  ORF Transcript_63021/g.172877 Transcript_63021/m.172877 type:complete len:88 (+) Transcript_63021:296-559(+)